MLPSESSPDATLREGLSCHRLASRLAAIGSACTLLTSASYAQAANALASVLSYKTTKVADGIYAFITPEERTGFQSGNSIAIIGDDAVLVFDTGNIPGSTRRQIQEIKQLTSKPVKYVVNSHWHPDHNLGNAEYRAAFPNVTIIGTTATRDGINERLLGYITQMRGFATQDSLMKVRLKSGRMRDSTPMPDSIRAFWTVYTGDYDAFWPELATAKPSAPDLVFDDSLTIALGKRQVKIMNAGRANTAGDAYVIVPDANVLLTGDLVTFPCPFPGTAFLGEWIAALDKLRAVNATSIVPGHGDVQHDYLYVTLVRDLLVFTRNKAIDAAKSGKTYEEFQKGMDYGTFPQRFSGGDAMRAASFNNFYAFAAMQRAWEEAKFLSQTPVLRP